MTKDQALTEFREASAAVRRAFSAHAEAREAQILANRNAADTSDALLKAQDRLDRADAALQESTPEATVGAAIDAAKGVTPMPNGATHVAEPSDMGIG